MFKKQPVASFIFLMEKKNKTKNKAVHGILFNFIFYCLYVVVIIKKRGAADSNESTAVKAPEY